MSLHPEINPGNPEARKFELSEVEAWPIKMGFYLQLEHGLMGSFPAIFAGAIGKNAREVVVFDRAVLINKVWPRMTPRNSNICSMTFYVSEELGVAFPVHNAEDMIKHAGPQQIPPVRFATETEIDDLVAVNPNPFEWAPGLIGDDMSEDEFKRTLRAAAESHGIQLNPQPQPNTKEAEAADFQSA